MLILIFAWRVPNRDGHTLNNAIIASGHPLSHRDLWATSLLQFREIPKLADRGRWLYSSPMVAAPTHHEHSESDLARALGLIGRGDQNGLAILHRLTAPKLFGICMRICKDHQAAEDVLSEVYLKVWQGKATFDPDRGNALPWLCTMARNRSIDWIRRYGRPTESDAVLAGLPSLEPDPEAVATSADEAGRLHLCLDSLKPDQRQAIRTAFFEGITYAELADRQSVPLGTIKTWVRRGLARLKDCLGG